jgi:hypothetical protein
LDIHWTSTDKKPNPKTVGEKSSPNPNPQDPKPTDIRPEPDPLSSLHPSALATKIAQKKLGK